LIPATAKPIAIAAVDNWLSCVRIVIFNFLFSSLRIKAEDK